MRIDRFELERWFARYEFEVDINLCASCATETKTWDLLGKAGPAAVATYLNLGLDYIPNPGTDTLREAVAGLYTTMTAQNVQITIGASEAIFLLMNVMLSPGETIIVQKPIYQSLYSVAESIGVAVKEWHMCSDNFTWDIADLTDLIDDDTKMIVINVPHSPTGTMLTAKQMQQIVQLVNEHQIWLLSDEVYRGILYDRSYECPAAADLTPRAISLGDMTKPYGLGGLRIGWLTTANKDVLQECSALRDYTSMCSAAPSEFLATLALLDKKSLLAEKMGVAQRNLTQLQTFVARHHHIFSLNAPQGGLTVFPKVLLPLDSLSFCQGLAEEYSVLLLPGSTFGMEGFVRIGLGLDPHLFDEGLTRLAKYLCTLEGRLST